MSSPDTSVQPSVPAWMRPWWFLAGLLAGLGALSYEGWQRGHTDFHPGFSRIYPAISPETNYLPTLDELLSIVRHRCRRDQVLVVVGGNSILAGVWQPEPDLWTKRLQEKLGDRYCVVNLAFRGGSPTDGGAVVAEVLRREFPRQIYVANEAPFNGVEAFAHEPYRYLFWQAYFRGWLLDSPGREKQISRFKWNAGQHKAYNEAAASVWLDEALNFRDLWNWVTFEKVCTVPSYLGDYVPAMLAPRRTFKDEEPDAFNPIFLARKYAPSSLDAEMAIVRGFTERFYHRGPSGEWVFSKPDFEARDGLNGEAFPKELKARTLILLSRNSPYYRRLLSAEEQSRDDEGYRQAVQLWARNGYPVMEYGRDFGDNDYGDRTHLSKTGGARLADAVAPRIEAMARDLHYLP
jgi:hypothetical protein